jgi:hypothetical protein
MENPNFITIIYSIIESCLYRGNEWVDVPEDCIESGHWYWPAGRKGPGGKLQYVRPWTTRAYNEIDEALIAVHRFKNNNMPQTQTTLQMIDKMIIPIDVGARIICQEYIHNGYEFTERCEIGQPVIDELMSQWLWSFPTYYAAVA